MTAQLAPSPIFRSFDAFGFPLYLGQLGTFIAGTNTPQATYKDSTMGAANTNPVILNPRGECNLWLDPAKAYKLVLSDALGNLIWTVDNVTIGNANPSYNIIPTVDNLFTLGNTSFAWANVFVGPNHAPVLDTATGNIGYYKRTSFEIAATVTPTNFVYPPGVVDRYGTNTTPGTTDMSAAVTAANAQWVQGGAAIQAVSGVYLISSTLTLAAPLIFSASASFKLTTITLNGPVSTLAGPTKIFTLPVTGVVAYMGAPTGGTLYVNGTYTNVPLTGGTGTGAQATIVVAGGSVTSVTITAVGTGYTTGDSLSASNANLGGAGSGFLVSVLSVAQVQGSLGNVDIYTRWYGDTPDGNYQTGTGTDNQPFFMQALGTLNLRATSVTTAPNRLITLPGVYRVNSKVFVGDNINWLGGGKYATTLFAPSAFADNAGLIAIAGRSSYPTRFSGFTVAGQIGGAGGQGIVSTKNAAFISDVWVTAFINHAGVVLSSTDNFLTDFACELNLYGLQVTASDVTVSNGTLYQNQAAGMILDNTGGVGNTDSGRITVTNVRDVSSVQNAFLVTGAAHVSLIGCHAVGIVNTNYNVGAFQIQNAVDVVLTGCTGTMTAGASTAPGILISSGCTDIVIDGCKMSGFYDGLQGNTVTYLNVTGGSYVGNSRNGILLSGGTAMVTGAQCRNNAAAGIDSENTTAASYHLVSSNQCISNSTFGIIANCGATSFTNVQANQNRVNSSGSISFTGTVANINQGAAPTNA